MLHQVILLARDSSCGTNNGFLPGLYDNLCSGGSASITSLSDILVVIGNLIRILIAASGALALIFIMVGGIFYVISTGDPARLKRAKDILTQAITGLVVVSLAYAIVTFLTAQFK